MDTTIEEVADFMFKMVEDGFGKKNYKPGDLIKTAKRQFGTDKKFGKAAIKELINSGRCVYSYFGGTYITIPHVEGAAK